jgi:hypothetical protein
LKALKRIWEKADGDRWEEQVRERIRSFLAGAARCDESESVRDSAAGLLREMAEKVRRSQ